ncbi:MAG: DUF1127 domain-containing protein [Alphaproteobacteria bacterium]|nr:DUF1127 domain-containing protein [Alphaproteobacteria bacterium SS10]
MSALNRTAVSHELASSPTHPLDLATRLEPVFALIAVWQTRAKQRRDLMALPDHMLQDIGVTRADAHREASKPFWKA